METPSIVIPDKYGNSIIVSGNVISLKLKSETRTREIGLINLQEKYLAVNRVRSKHLFRKNSSYGFNHYILLNAKKFDKIKLSDDIGTWLIPIKLILEKGSFLHFNKDGFELQIFLPLDIITSSCAECSAF
jgi:hypothetical protein